MVFWLLFLGTVLVLFIFYINKKLMYWNNYGIPSPVDGIWTYLQLMHFLLKRPSHEFQIQMYKNYGRIHGLILGFQRYLSVADPDLVKSILVKDFNKFQSRMKFESGDPTIDKMMQIIEGEDWKRIRCVVSPSFSSGRIRKMTYLIKECAEKFTNHIEGVVEKNDMLDCKRYFFNFTIDVIASTAFGSKLDSLNDPKNDFVLNARSLATKDSPVMRILFYTVPSAMRLIRLEIFGGKTFQYFKKFALQVIHRRDKEHLRRNDFLQLMIDAQKGILEKTQDDIQEENEDREKSSAVEMLHRNKTMSIDEMLAQCNVFLFAGNEIVANTLALAIHFMALYPKCQEKLIAEVDELWGKHESINFDALNNMTYLEAVISETLRIMPTIPEVLRICTEDYVYEPTGLKIPKGMHITVPVFSIHHDPENFPNPEIFDPERFMPDNRSSIPQYVYLPFGDGPRYCIGMRFAMVMMKMFIVHLLRKFRVSATEETKKPLVFWKGQAVLEPKHIFVRFEKRK